MTEQAHHTCGKGTSPCGCCAGTGGLTPSAVANRPGLKAIAYRAGTHATFLETMKARLSSLCLGRGEDCLKGQGNYPLRQLNTREADDPSIALLDAWATVADVLTFYQERIANEGYLRTATERRSILELARLVGYRLRPGVASSVFLALTLDPGSEVVIEPFQLRAQSVPGPGEMPQTFENTERLDARVSWNKLRPRMTQPQRTIKIEQWIDPANVFNKELYLKGVATNLSPNDPLLIVVGGKTVTQELFRVIEVKPEAAADRTLVLVQPWVRPEKPLPLGRQITKFVEEYAGTPLANPALDRLHAELNDNQSDLELADFIKQKTLPELEAVAARRVKEQNREILRDLSGSLAEAAMKLSTITGTVQAVDALVTSTTPENFDLLRMAVTNLSKPTSVPPANALRLKRTVNQVFSLRNDLGLQAFGSFLPQLRASVPAVLARASIAPTAQISPMEVYALRVKAAPFGNNAPRRVVKIDSETGQITETGEWPIQNDENQKTIFLDASYDKILPGSWVVIDASAIQKEAASVKPADTTNPMIRKVNASAAGMARAAYGISGKTTKLDLDDNWIVDKVNIENDFKVFRNTVVFAQSEKLELAEAPIETTISDGTLESSLIVLDGIYSDLKSGRRVIVSGERSDITDGAGKAIRGVKGSELAMIAEVTHEFDENLPGDSVHTRIKLANPLKYSYRRDAVTIYANVVKATHGETRREVLGSGNGSQELQQFALRQPPLTYVSAPTTDGVESTLNIFVNDVRWREAETLFGLQPADRRFITRQSDDEITTAVFGNGRLGARLPTGRENVRVEYRQGIGKAANVKADQITLLQARPLGVRDVLNPLQASGGADKESRDQARKNVPLALMALDRLVSTQDYQDFASTFAGVGKAFARRLSDGRRELVHVTIAGIDDIPIDQTSDLFLNLSQALRRFGEPMLPLQLALRELQILIISANVRLHPDFVWEKVAPRIRARLLSTFSFEKRELGQDALLSEAISAMQGVAGVAYVDVDIFGGVSERNLNGTVRTPKEIVEAVKQIAGRNRPNQRVRVTLPDITDVPIRPAQLAYLTPDVPDTLILNQV